MGRASADLYIEKVELNWIIPVHILIRKEKLLPECEYGRLLNTLLPQRLVRVQPVYWREGAIDVSQIQTKEAIDNQKLLIEYQNRGPSQVKVLMMQQFVDN